MRRECRERFPRHRFQRKPLVSDPGMHHGTCVKHVPWCISGSLTNGGEENVICMSMATSCMMRKYGLHISLRYCDDYGLNAFVKFDLKNFRPRSMKYLTIYRLLKEYFAQWKFLILIGWDWSLLLRVQINIYWFGLWPKFVCLTWIREFIQTQQRSDAKWGYIPVSAEPNKG